MDEFELGSIYCLACSRISSASTELYEILFDKEGQPIGDLEHINAHIKLFQRQVSAEADLIRQGLIEYKELND